MVLVFIGIVSGLVNVDSEKVGTVKLEPVDRVHDEIGTLLVILTVVAMVTVAAIDVDSSMEIIKRVNIMDAKVVPGVVAVVDSLKDREQNIALNCVHSCVYLDDVNKNLRSIGIYNIIIFN